MKISADPIYTSAACNRTTEAADWNSDGLICFGACNAVVVYNTSQNVGDPLTVLSHHKSQVNSVKWLRRPDGTSTEFVSCSADKTAAIWTLQNGIFKVSHSLEGHKDGITSIGGAYLNEDDVVVFTASIDSTVRVWERKNGTINPKQIINLNSGLCLTLHAHLLSTGKLLLFLALDNNKINLFAESDRNEYEKVHSLTGHEDWVRGLDVLDIDKNTLLLASSSQDTYIRLWRIEHYTKVAQPSMAIEVEQEVFDVHGKQWSAKLDAVLAGHEGWVYGVQWAPRDRKQNYPVYRLLSSSLDKTLIIWEPEVIDNMQDGVWVERVRVGEVGGNGLGFYGSKFGPGGRSFMGHGYNGTFHIWGLDEGTNQWLPKVVCAGHFGAVEDARWDPTGKYLISVGTDETTRIHAPWNTELGSQWHEIARPQVHGYEMSSVATISSTTFVSSAEEKVIRVFRAPHNFIDNFKNITGCTIVDGIENGGVPEGASVPSLGLSNKAVFTDDEGRGDAAIEETHFVSVKLTEPPTEETLMQNTLWPEIHKLYGHGYEVFALDASRDGALVASSCKATTAEHAAVLIWETKNWQQIQKLVSHQLTVTQLAFSPNSQHLLSVSRDRKWTLYQRAQGANSFDIVACTDKSNGVHTRIIWCCAWDNIGEVFATGSREGKVCVWHYTNTTTETSLKQYGLFCPPLEVAYQAVTALDFAPTVFGQVRLLALGCDSGLIKFYTFAKDRPWEMVLELNNSSAHHLTVKRLKFKPPQDNTKSLTLASCSTDHFVRIFNVNVMT